MPAPRSLQRTALIAALAEQVDALGPARLRVAVDGVTGAGKTSFGHELAAAVRALGRPTLRASLDDFKRPWSDARAKGYDRVTGEGYYRNAPDFEAARALLLEPSGGEGSGVVSLCAFDPLTGEDHRSHTVVAPGDSVLIVDSVFALRPEYDDCWELRVWLTVEPSVAFERAIARDQGLEGREEAERLHRDRYRVGERIYVDEVDPEQIADVVVDNTDLDEPRFVRRARGLG